MTSRVIAPGAPTSHHARVPPSDRPRGPMSTHEQLAQRYIALWNETDPAARRRGVEDLWSEDARYVDPLADAQGHEAIDATIAAVQGQFPDFEFRLAGPV